MRVPRSAASLLARQLLGDSRERSLFAPALIAELMNASTASAPDSGILNRFSALRKESVSASWRQVIGHPGIAHIIKIVPLFTQRPLEGAGDMFVLFTHIFWAAKEICGHSGSNTKEIALLIQFLSVNSEFPGLLTIFLFFDKFVFQSKFFRTVLDKEMMDVWKRFVAVMWETISHDKELCTALSSHAAQHDR
jgi:hypothetical protein